MDELLPGVPAHVDGILDIRDEIISILSGHSLFGINNSNNTDKPYYSAGNTSHIGIIVNKPGELISVRPEQIEQAFGTSNEDLIKARPAGDELVILLDISDNFQRIAGI